MSSNTISQRRVVGFIALALLAVVAVLAFGTLMASCLAPAVTPSASAVAPTASSDVPSPSASPVGTAGASPGSADPGASASPSGPATAPPSGAPVPTIVLPTARPGNDGPEPSIEIPPPIR
jgi:hypothetical protein